MRTVINAIFNDRKIKISAGSSRKSLAWKNQSMFWSELVSKLKIPAKSIETLEEYMSLSKSKQDELKDVGGFVAGELRDGRRKDKNVISRDVITLDLDNVKAGGTKDVLTRIESLGCAYAVYSTRKHSEYKPRLRVLLPMDVSCTADEYEPIARKIASIIGVELCDPTTFQASRLMYWPSCSSDSTYVFESGDKPFLSKNGVLAMYSNWENISEWPEVPGFNQVHKKLISKQGNPLEKNGIVGAFCRTYDIYNTINTFLSEEYTHCDVEDRFTFTGGSTTGGAVVYENGNFLFSHHATDPAGGNLCNSFDLVRLHRFSELDGEAKDGTPPVKMPSYVAMCQLAMDDSNVALLLSKERYENATKEFNTSVEDDANWMLKLEKNPNTGMCAKTRDNILIILENDPLLRGKIAFDEFSNRGLVLGPLPWDGREERRDWANNDDRSVKHYLEKVYGIESAQRVDDGLGMCAFRNKFNDVADYLNSIEWDGVKRLEALMIDYLGAKDDIYVRTVTRKAFIAAVARAINPGVKFDEVLILAGPQGVGKSTLLRFMGKKWYSDSLTSFEGKEASEMLQGVWINELGELSSLNRTESNIAKQFLSRTEDIYREPFGKRTGRYPRRCVFFGTSNESEFLKDTTGNRRFWPVRLMEIEPTKNVFDHLEEEVDQIWAEAMHYYNLGEKLYLPNEVKELAKEVQESYQESSAKEGIVREFLDKKIPRDWNKRGIAERRLYWSSEFGKSDVDTVERDRVCAAEIWCECLGGDIKYMKRTDATEINGILARLKGWERHTYPKLYGCYGNQRGYTKII